MIAFAGAELPRSAARRINEQGVAGVTLFRAPQRRRSAPDPPADRRHPGGTAGRGTAAADRRRPGGRPAGRPGRRDDASSPARWRSARPATRRWPSASPARRARELRALGVNVNYAPVCDVANNPANPALGIRSFGDDPEAVGRLAAATVRGLQGAGVAATAKHFPGAGDTAADPHHELPLVPPDERRAGRAGAGPVSSGPGRGRADGHDRPLRACPTRTTTCRPACPPRSCATCCAGSCAFDGVTVTDALDMRALAQGSAQIVDAVAALRAGEDVLLGTVDEPAMERLEEGLAQAQRRGLIDADDDAAARRRLDDLRRWLGRLRPAAARRRRVRRTPGPRRRARPTFDHPRPQRRPAVAVEAGRRRADRGRPVDARRPDAGRHVVDGAADARIGAPPPARGRGGDPPAGGAWRGRHRRSRRAARGLRPRRRRDVLRAPPAGAGGAGRGRPGVRQADRHRRPAHAVGPARLPVRPNPRLQLRHPAAVDGGAGGRAAGRGAVRRPAARRHRRPVSARSRARGRADREDADRRPRVAYARR